MQERGHFEIYSSRVRGKKQYFHAPVAIQFDIREWQKSIEQIWIWSISLNVRSI